MHNNFYFLRQLSLALGQALQDHTLVSCFTQNKDEMVLEFNRAGSPFFLRACLTSEFCCLSFPSSFNRARKNSVDLFAEAILKKVTGVRQFENERSFAILLEDSRGLLFKMHGNRANVILLNNDQPVEIFRNHLKTDAGINPNELDRILDWSQAYFLAHQSELKRVYFTFGKEVWHALRSRGFDEADVEKRWELLQAAKKELENPRYYLFERSNMPVFSLLTEGGAPSVFTEPIPAINEFYIRYTGSYSLHLEKSSAVKTLEAKVEAGRNYIEKNKRKIDELLQDVHYQQWADLIMANLHNLAVGVDKVKLENFYDDHRPVEIKMRKDRNAQQNAADYYRKAKNQQIEIQKLKESIDIKEKEIESLLKKQVSIKYEPGLSNLRKMIAEPGTRKGKPGASVPYHEFEFKGFTIWVGKNAASNDELTQRHSYKDDLWLHAKDVAGSHVLIKHQAGKPFPKDVIERAAELAAYYSKRKNESLCPVAVTEKKYVRKRKGDPVGAVVVERERVVLVTPRGG